MSPFFIECQIDKDSVQELLHVTVPTHILRRHIQQMDEAIGGARDGELWVHAAFAGHLKTTFALNWAYNQAIWFHDNVLYFSLEMPYHQVRRWLLAPHILFVHHNHRRRSHSQ